MKNIRLAAPSFILRDTRLANAAMLDGFVDEVQLLYTDSGRDEYFPHAREVASLTGLRVGFQAHLPTDCDLRQASSWDVLERMVTGLAALHPATHTIHGVADAAFVAHCDRFITRTGASVTVENDSGDTEPLRAGVDAGADVCVDVGHLVRDGVDPMAVLERFSSSTKLIHLHGVTPSGQDHRPVTHLDTGMLDAVCAFALESKITVCIEVFALSHLVCSVAALERSCERIRHPRNRGHQER